MAAHLHQPVGVGLARRAQHLRRLALCCDAPKRPTLDGLLQRHPVGSVPRGAAVAQHIAQPMAERAPRRGPSAVRRPRGGRRGGRGGQLQAQLGLGLGLSWAWAALRTWADAAAAHGLPRKSVRGRLHPASP
jgi:hypothetical protein